MRFFALASRRMLLLLAFALLSGCSAVRITYNQADMLLAWMAHDYFDLTAQQQREFNTRVDTLLAWHRHEQLPDYSRFLGEIRHRTQRAATRDDALWLIAGAKERFRLITAKSAPDIADLLASLTSDNISALQKQFDKVNKKFVAEYKLNGTQDERRRARLERTLKRIHAWTGPLAPAQEARIAALNEAIPYIDHLRHQDRLRRQQEFLVLLHNRGNRADFARALRVWLADWEAGRPPELHAALNAANDKRITLYLETERMLTPHQRAHLQLKLQGYIDDLNALAARHAA